MTGYCVEIGQKYTRRARLGLALTSSLLVIGTLPCAAYGADQAQELPNAENSKDEIIVTAQRRAEKSVDVPVTVTLINTEMLETANIQSLADIGQVTPSLRFDSQFQFFQPTIRGVGTSVTTSGGGSNVGIYVDGFYSPNPVAADFELLNVQSIQVLKGPQGTLFGRNTTGGAILVQSADPSTETGGSVKASYGRFNQKRLQGYATFGLSDNIAVDVEGSYRSGNGFHRNIINNSKKDGRFENWSARFGLKADISDSVSLLLRYMHGDVDDPTSLLTNSYVDPVLGITAPNFAPPITFTTQPNEFATANQRFFRAKNDVLQATVKADLGFANLTSYSQYRGEDTDASIDLDQVGITVFQFGLPVDNATYSQEFLFTSKPGSALQWTAGLFYFQNRDTYTTLVDNNIATVGRIPLGGSSTTTKTLAAFADLTYEVSPALFVTAGGRISHDKITDAYFIPAFSGVAQYVTQAQSDAVNKKRFTPRLVVRYKPSEQSSVYASFTQGHKAGVLDVGGSTGNPVRPEKIDAFEIGYKFDDRRLSFEAAGFYYNYKDLQISLFEGNPPSAKILNAANSEIYGLEGQARYDVSEAFQLNVAAAWTHARYKKFDNAPVYKRCPTVAGCGGGTSFFIQPGVTLTDVTMTHTPSFTGNVGMRYTADLGEGKLTLSSNLYVTSKFFFGPTGIQFPQKGYETLSLRAQWSDPSDRFTLAAWSDNVTNSRYINQVQYNNFGIGSGYSAPITYGLEFGAKF